jgi:hypothetical protein
MDMFDICWFLHEVRQDECSREMHHALMDELRRFDRARSGRADAAISPAENLRENRLATKHSAETTALAIARALPIQFPFFDVLISPICASAATSIRLLALVGNALRLRPREVVDRESAESSRVKRGTRGWIATPPPSSGPHFTTSKVARGVFIRSFTATDRSP